MGAVNSERARRQHLLMRGANAVELPRDRPRWPGAVGDNADRKRVKAGPGRNEGLRHASCRGHRDRSDVRGLWRRCGYFDDTLVEVTIGADPEAEQVLP